MYLFMEKNVVVHVRMEVPSVPVLVNNDQPKQAEGKKARAMKPHTRKTRGITNDEKTC